MPRDPIDVLRLNRAQARKLAERVGQREVRKLLEDAATEFRARLEARIATGAGTETSAREAQLALAQVRDVTRELARGIGTTTARGAKSVAEVGVEGITRYMQDANRVYARTARPLAIKESAMLRRAVQGAESTVLRRLATTETRLQASNEDPTVLDDVEPRFQVDRGSSVLSRYTFATIEQFEQELSTAVATRRPWGDVRDSLTKASPFLQGAPASWAERIARTETMGAYNRSGWESIREADDELGDMVKILSATFDSRTAWDSYQVHGQIRKPDEAFAWAGGLYQHPPNRPNDREVVVPHRLSWPLPDELRYRSDAEVMAAWTRDRRKGAPPPRPEPMSTVALERFGRG